jgi:hypothetical protein
MVEQASLYLSNMVLFVAVSTSTTGMEFFAAVNHYWRKDLPQTVLTTMKAPERVREVRVASTKIIQPTIHFLEDVTVNDVVPVRRRSTKKLSVSLPFDRPDSASSLTVDDNGDVGSSAESLQKIHDDSQAYSKV